MRSFRQYISESQTLHFNFPSRVQGDAFTKEVRRISGAKAEHDEFGYVRVQNSGNQEKKIRQAAAKHGGRAGMSEATDHPIFGPLDVRFVYPDGSPPPRPKPTLDDLLDRVRNPKKFSLPGSIPLPFPVDDLPDEDDLVPPDEFELPRVYPYYYPGRGPGVKFGPFEV